MNIGMKFACFNGYHGKMSFMNTLESIMNTLESIMNTLESIMNIPETIMNTLMCLL